MTPRYKIEQINTGSCTLWIVKEGRKILSHHVDLAEANRTVMRYINEDRDFAMES